MKNMWSYMGKKFKVGKFYECANFYMNPIKVLYRTKKNIVVDDGECQWSAKTKIDNDGDEFIQKDTKLVTKGIYTYSASWEI